MLEVDSSVYKTRVEVLGDIAYIPAESRLKKQFK